MTGRKVENTFGIVTAPFFLATMAVGASLLLNIGNKVEGVVHLGCPTYIWAILEVAHLLGGSFGRSLVTAIILGFVLASCGV